jgi:uncharacterized protein
VTPPYIDTSALAKWYLNEPQSENFENFIARQTSAAIGRLTLVEFRCLLARRRRAGEITKSIEAKVYDTFADDIRAGVFAVHPLHDDHALAAVRLITRLNNHPLRTLDALHLAIALELEAQTLATADRIMASAGKDLGFDVAAFF